MNSEIIQNVAYDNYDDFQHVNFMFSQNFLSLFWRLCNEETYLKVRYAYILMKSKPFSYQAFITSMRRQLNIT